MAAKKRAEWQPTAHASLARIICQIKKLVTRLLVRKGPICHLHGHTHGRTDIEIPGTEILGRIFIECRGIFEHKKQKMAVIPMLRVEAWVLLPNALKRLAFSSEVFEGSSSEISNL
jgi:hypothetical protein